jgi:hypothetical protein
MTIVTSYDFESDTWTHHNGDTAVRAAWRQAVEDIAQRAKQTLPECSGRVDKAVKIVLAGDVELQPDGTARVASQSNGITKYFVVNGACSCPDYAKAPSHWCKHRISAGIAKRVHARLRQQGEEATNGRAPTPTTPEEEPPATETTPEPSPTTDTITGLPEALKPHLVHLHGKPFVQYAGLLALAHERGLISLKASFISVTPELALAAAQATFADGTSYSECADATPGNVGAQVRAHFPRLALTRAKARTLRDALNIGITALEELAGE